MSIRWWHYPIILVLALPATALLLVALVATLAYPSLPSIEALTDYRPKIPLRVYTREGALIEEYGAERRALTRIDQVPEVLKQAIVAAEDERFWQHPGVDYLGVVRAALANLSAGRTREGASTITMQVARNFFLSRDKTLARKFSEALLAFKIEHRLSKEQILEIYINQIYLGQRAYGFGAAAQIYFGIPLERIDTAQAAMLAGLPKAPSAYNPVSNPRRARARQLYVLGRMHELGFIDRSAWEQARDEKLHIHNDLRSGDVSADYVAEMVRQYMFERYGEAAYTEGFSVYTTLLGHYQQAARQALVDGLLAYDRRQGYRGPEARVTLPEEAGETFEEHLEEVLARYRDINGLVPAVVLRAAPGALEVWVRGRTVTLEGDAVKFAVRALSGTATPSQRLARGAIIRLRADPSGGWEVTQLPEAEAALVAMAPENGAILALAGGFDFQLNKFNHVVQAWRQPGSSFKPFIYSAALERGFTASSLVADSPLSIFDAGSGKNWEPRNYDGRYAGPMTLRDALIRSKNLVSIRILQDITPQYAQEYASRFGFDPAQHPAYLPMALGAGMVTPLQMAAAYSVFANGGYTVLPWFIERVMDGRGEVVEQTQPQVAGAGGGEPVIDPRNVFIMDSILRDVVRRGTATRAKALGRSDLAGKTGTTNDFLDAWFCGYTPSLVAISWVGFDQPRSLGRGETGGQTALPIWVDFMKVALEGVPEQERSRPEGLVTRGVGAGVEYFYQENVSGRQLAAPEAEDGGASSAKPSDEARDELF